MSNSFDRQIKESASSYQAEPKLDWDSVEKRLQESGKKKVRWFYARIAAVAIVLLLSAFIANQYISTPAQQNSLFVSAETISELDDQKSLYIYGGGYAVKDLYRAYQNSGVHHDEDALNGLR